jgi:hypothetical protein
MRKKAQSNKNTEGNAMNSKLSLEKTHPSRPQVGFSRRPSEDAEIWKVAQPGYTLGTKKEPRQGP